MADSIKWETDMDAAMALARAQKSLCCWNRNSGEGFYKGCYFP